MRLSTMADARRSFVVVHADGVMIDLSVAAPELPQDVVSLFGLSEAVADAVARADATTHVDPSAATYLPVLPRPGKVICAGLNYRDHAEESGFAMPEYPALFARSPPASSGTASPSCARDRPNNWISKARSQRSSVGPATMCPDTMHWGSWRVTRCSTTPRYATTR